MSRILLVDDSPHAQRLGERILTDEGYEVVTVSNAESAIVRLEDVDPDVVIADTVMPGRTGYDICDYVKINPRHKHVRVILTAGVLEPIDEDRARKVQSDGSVNKPFEASALVSVVKPLADAAGNERAPGSGKKEGAAAHGTPAALPFVAVVDAEQVRAAVTIALDASMSAMVDEISRRVVTALQKKPEAAAQLESTTSETIAPAKAEAPPVEPPVRRTNPLRMRSSSILGLDADVAPAQPQLASSPAKADLK